MKGTRKVGEKVLEGLRCPYCNGAVYNLFYSYACEHAGIGGSCKFYVEKAGGKITEDDLRDFIIKGRTRMIPKLCHSQSKGMDYDAAIKLNAKESDRCYSFDFTAHDDTTDIACPWCGRKIIVKANSFMCEGFKDEDCNFSISRYDGKLTIDDLKDLIQNKKTRLIKEICWSKKKGKFYSAYVTLNPKGSGKSTSFEFPHRGKRQLEYIYLKDFYI